MKLLSVIFICLTLAIGATASAKSLELSEIQVVAIEDSVTQRPYDLYIKLPESYQDTTDKRYPVIYYTDAMWHVEQLSVASSYIMKDVILVGISWQKGSKDLNAGFKKERGEHVSRYRDYSHFPSENEEHQHNYRFGGADTHLAFIRKDVIRYVEKTYRTLPDNRTYFGYSLGGSFGSYILMSQPDSFKNYVLGSPSVQRLSEMEEKGELIDQPLNANVFFAHGTQGNELPRAEQIYRFMNLLNKREDNTLSLTFKVIEGTHSSAFPGTVLQSVQWLKAMQPNGNGL